jgi:hypothetical protein
MGDVVSLRRECEHEWEVTEMLGMRARYCPKCKCGESAPSEEPEGDPRGYPPGVFVGHSDAGCVTIDTDGKRFLTLAQAQRVAAELHERIERVRDRQRR